ncbi:DUF2529 domain-containing protein [Salisediminibacterium selenitireducens]|uniref:DUF2529 domain-containing protein n=1 Tax=Bacillus selenitireducens (strain ATCC 700615 / DSM 15326 / MLS10) TaxID=439292 RepID=D6Y0U7_BACIE|nr:DUF2529 domain-containing protein [Salisediminibacterium selenitireducens]ADI00665.1 Protein of unknown function DUF2529 [[Bacillus] selenitireducens MLS10]
MKMFFTQLQGLAKDIEDQEDIIEDAARLLAMSIVSDGSVYWYSEGEMDGIVTQAMTGDDGIPDSKRWSEAHSLSEQDTVVICSKWRDSVSASDVAKRAEEAGATVIGITSAMSVSKDKHDWTTGAELLLVNGVSKGLIPSEDGETRIGTPHLLAGLHVYYTLFFVLRDILDDQMA